jgi:DNA-binding transcriptional LysR family regulator
MAEELMLVTVPHAGRAFHSDRARRVSKTETRWQNHGVTTAEANPLAGSDLAAFVAAFEAGSVHGGADALGLTPSAITKRVQSLERRTGVRLFDRSRRGLRPTAAAQLLYPEAKQALSVLAHAEATLARHREASGHALALAASHTIGECLLPGWLAAFRHEHPGVRAQIDVVNSPGVLAAVRARRADIGFVEGHDPVDDLEAVTVDHDEIVAVVARGHRWSRRRRLVAADLVGEPYLTRERGSGTRAVATAALAAAGVELEPSLEAASTQSVKRALMAGGFALLSRLAVATEVHSGALHAIAVHDLDLSRALRAVRHPGAVATGDTRAFWDWLAARDGARGAATVPVA